MSTADDVKTVLTLGLPLVELGTQLLRNQISSRDAALRAVDFALSQIPVEELRTYLTQGDRDRAELAADVAATFAFGPKP